VQLKHFLKYSFTTGLAMPVIGIVFGAGVMIEHRRSEPKLPEPIEVIAPPDTGKKEPKLPYPFPDNLTDALSNQPSLTMMRMKINITFSKK